MPSARQTRHRSLQAGVLRLELFETLRLIDLHATVLFTPAVIRLVGDAQLFAYLGDGLVLREQNIGFSQLVNDFFGVVSFRWQGSDLLIGFLPLSIWTRYFRPGHRRSGIAVCCGWRTLPL
jgi:hypothetical protein